MLSLLLASQLGLYVKGYDNLRLLIFLLQFVNVEGGQIAVVWR